jgi:hypothetical protein
LNFAFTRTAHAETDLDVQHKIPEKPKTTLEDLEGRRELAAARKRNPGKPGTFLRQAAKELGL